MAKLQAFQNQKAEVDFRRELIKQHMGIKTIFEGQPDHNLIIEELKKRIKETRVDFKNILKKKINISPFLEIGAEKCQRAIYLENALNFRGFAADISLESLQSADYFIKILGYKKMPTRICIDAYHLPFRDNSLPFIFFYETLHHFPYPKPVLDEALRVLQPGGFVFFGGEPVKQLINLRLFRRDFRLNLFEKLLKYVLILPFISIIGKSEVEHGVLEETFWIDVWEGSLKGFGNVTTWIKPYLIGGEKVILKTKKYGWLKPGLLTFILLAIQGGGINVLAQKKLPKRNPVYFKSNGLLSLLACPNCKPHPKFKLIEKNELFCGGCQTRYRKIKGVFLLLPKKQSQVLYSSITKDA